MARIKYTPAGGGGEFVQRNPEDRVLLTRLIWMCDNILASQYTTDPTRISALKTDLLHLTVTFLTVREALDLGSEHEDMADIEEGGEGDAGISMFITGVVLGEV